MKIIKPSIEVEPFNVLVMLINIEKAGRTCYKSESKITPTSASEFITMIIKRGHESVLEHEKISVRVICDRGVTHEIVRHRIGSYSQESTRYCNYAGKDMEFINPCFWNDKENGQHEYSRHVWEHHLKNCEDLYNELIDNGATPQEARSILPNSLKTEIVITYNLRQWRWFFKKRCAKDAHPQMQEIANMILTEFKKRLPEVFRNI